MKVVIALLCFLGLFVAGHCIERGTFDHIFIMNFENEWYHDVIQNQLWSSLASRGRVLSNYYAVTHPSQPNYMAQVTGSTCGIKDDDKHNVSTTSIVDLLDKAELTWKAYMENYPTNGDWECYTKKKGPEKLYARKHNPFMNIDNIRTVPTRCRNFYNEQGFEADVAAVTKGQQALPNLMYYTPNMLNDGHDTNITYAGTYLTKFLTPLLDNPAFMNRTLIVTTWDEDDSEHDNKVLTMLFGEKDKIQPGTLDGTKYNHYSLLRTLEDNWGLGTLKRNDETAISFNL